MSDSRGFESVFRDMTGQGMALVTIPSLKMCFTSTHMFAEKDTDRKAHKVMKVMSNFQNAVRNKGIECDVWFHGGNFGSRLNGSTGRNDNVVHKMGPSMMWKGPPEHLGLLDEICEQKDELAGNLSGFNAPGMAQKDVWKTCSLENAAAKEYDELAFAIRDAGLGLQEFEPSSGIPTQSAPFPPTYPVQQCPGNWLLEITHGDPNRALHTCYANAPMFPDRILFKNAGKGAVIPGYYHVPDTTPRSGFRHLPVAASFQYAHDGPAKVLRVPYGDPYH